MNRHEEVAAQDRAEGAQRLAEGEQAARGAAEPPRENLARSTGGSSPDAGSAASPSWRCKFGLHSWRGGKRLNTDPNPFSISPIVGTRVCAACGKRQRFLYDSQGGAWDTITGGHGG